MLPTVAEVLLLDPLRRGSPRVLAAADRLDAPVRWVHVLELAHAGHLLRGGELVLSTGIALPPDPHGLASYVADLAAAGASALAVELGSRYVRELPRPLVDAASAHRLPLIVLERETRFVAVTEAVHERILADQVGQLRAAERLHQVFTDLALAGASAHQVVTRASALAGAPVILADLAHRVLACAPAGQEVAALLDGFAARSRAVTIRSGYDPASGWLVATVGAARGAWGRLVVVRGGPPAPADEVLAERAATTLELAALVSARSPERQAHASLLAALAGAAYADPVDVRARIAALGLPLAGQRLLPVVVTATGAAGALAGVGGVHDAAADTVAGRLAAACEHLGVPALAGPIDAPPAAVDAPPGAIGARPGPSAAAVLALPQEADADAVLARLAARLRGEDARQPGAGSAAPVTLGAGRVVTGLGEVRDALAEAADAAGAATVLGTTVLGTTTPVAHLAELRLAGLAYQLRDDYRALAFAERELGPLLAHDASAGTDLTSVLSCYLDAGGNKAVAARRAGLARPTLYERLRQIEQVLGVSLEAVESRLALHAALLVRRASARDHEDHGR